MLASHILVSVFVAAVGASSLPEHDIFTALLKRQEPGTPAYDCHDNCGTAITVSKSGVDVCSDAVFLYDYGKCLQCAGPDNYNIWRYYGGTLTTAAEKCGLETEPKSGKQADPGAAKHPGDSVSSSSAVSEASSTPSATSSAPQSTGGAQESTVAATSEAASSAAATSEAVTSGAVTSEAATSTGAVSVTSATAVVSGSPSSSTNGTASFTPSPPQQTTNAGIALLPNAEVMLGMAVVGAAYGLGY